MCGICFVYSCSQLTLTQHGSESTSAASSDVEAKVEHSCRQTAIHNLNKADSVGTVDPRNSTSHTHQDTTFVQKVFKDPLLHHRGPDVAMQHKFEVAQNIDGFMQGCVLHLRGNVTPQPLVDKSGNALLWNGEIFDSIQVQEHENDTQVLFDILLSTSSVEEILETMERIQGPWSFIFWQSEERKLWFGRDMYGRRSLLWHLPSSVDDYIVLSSIALAEMVYTEIPSVGIFCLDFSALSMKGDINNGLPVLTLYPWADCKWPGTTVSVMQTEKENLLTYLYPNQISCLPIKIDGNTILQSWIPAVNSALPEAGVSEANFDLKSSDNMEDILGQLLKDRRDLDVLAEQLIRVLETAVEKRVNNLPRHTNDNKDNNIDKKKDGERKDGRVSTPPGGDCQSLLENDCHGCHSVVQERQETIISDANVAILFSGGLDSTVLAALADRCVPADEPIDLLNVAFEQPLTNNPTKTFNKKPRKTNKKDRVTNKQDTISSAGGKSGLENSESQKVLLKTSSEVIKDDIKNAREDLTVKKTTCAFDERDLVLAGDGAVVDLDNLGICESMRGDASCSASTECSNPNIPIPDPYNVPDRQTGRLAFSELNPDRKWNFVEINVTQAELQALRQSHIRRLIYPLQTVLDDSIGCAVWFAARGFGLLANDKSQPFVSKAKVILCGMAADEQFAGYSRHRVTFNTKGWEGLLAEIQGEMWRISARNLGRDDRIITDHGKESRFPFLDEKFTQFVSSIPLHHRADLGLPRGIGEKLLLRLSALKLGLVQTATQPKRAIQFGSKIAKLDNRKEKGSDVCHRLT